MKLLTKINRNFLLTSLTLIALCSFLFYFMLKSVILSQVDENLMEEKDQIIQTLQEKNQLPVAQSLAGEQIEMRKVTLPEKIPESLQDTMLYDTSEQEYIPYRQLSFLISGGEENFVITIRESLIESDDLIQSLLIFLLILISALLAVLYISNRKMSKTIWFPFNDTLEKLKSFDLTGKNKTSFTHTGITEFEELNQSLNKMTERIYSDYSRLKQFTENASHEIQTPLSIIRSRIEILIQSEHISEEQMNSIQKINEAVSRLSKLNSALLTLTKIENHQFSDAEEIHLASFIRSKIRMLEEMLEQKKITVSIQAPEDVYLKMNTSLADLLFDNLIGNAMKHNIENGYINISVQRNEFIISNSGEPLQIAPEKLFDRFVKNDASSDSLGLGLSMVKQICMSYHFKINFRSEKNIHTVELSF